MVNPPSDQSRPARIWYQSFVHPTEQAPYIERLQASLDQLASIGTRFEVHGLDPPDHSFHALTEFRCAAQTIATRSRRSAPDTTPSSSATSRNPGCSKSAAPWTFPCLDWARPTCLPR